MERIATGNTILGGASALMLANRLHRMKGTDLRGVVADVYSASTGSQHRLHGAFTCPECGSACLGIDAAWQHCTEGNEE